MSIEAAASHASAPCTETSIFEEEWKDCGGGGPFEDMEVVPGFDANSRRDNRGDVDPQQLNTPSNSDGTLNLLLEDVRNQQTQEDRTFTTLAASMDPFVDGVYGMPPTANQAGSTDRTVTPSVFDPDYASLGRPQTLVSFHQPHLFQDQMITPSYYPSIELHNNNGPSQQLQMYPNFSHHHEFHRRSVSEPPTGPISASFQHYQHQPSAGLQAPMTFRRANRIVGTQTQPQELTRLKPLPQDRRQNRHQPYSIKKRDEQNGRHRREKLRRAKTQPLRAPTSVPSSPMQSRQMIYVDESPVMLSHQVPSSQISPLQLVSTRICTPTPSPERMASPGPIGGEPLDCTNGTTNFTDEKAAPLSISVSVEQLQALITEAVQKAVKMDSEISEVEK